MNLTQKYNINYANFFEEYTFLTKIKLKTSFLKSLRETFFTGMRIFVLTFSLKTISLS